MATTEQPSKLEALVTDALDGRGPKFFPGLAGAKLAAKLAVRPQVPLKHGVGLGSELASVLLGRSSLKPDKGDRRFKDPLWSENPAFHRLCQAYLALGEAVDGTISGATLDWRSERRVRLAATNVLDALAPSNFPVTNPSVLKATTKSRGRNLVAGARRFAQDMRTRPQLPSSVDESKFRVGRDLAVTPGSVILRTEVFELIEYDPQTEEVHDAPLLLAPQMINKYYITDLAPGRSMLEHAVRQGQQTFAISWRNPDERHREWGFDTYCSSVLEALEAIERVTGSDRTHLVGPCAGGNVAAAVAGYLAANGEQDRLASLTLLVAVLDWSSATTAGAFLDQATAAAAKAESARKGYLDGRSLAGMFAWMRPNDMIWGYVINNYYLGKPPPAFDVLYWNADQTNMPAALHRDFIRLGMDNALGRPGGLHVLGTPIDLSEVTLDAYVVAGSSDHISPWRAVYRSAQLLGAEPRFVLSTSGHIVALVNPTQNSKARWQTAEDNPEDPDEWLEEATENDGSWWTDWTDWLAQRSGGSREAPREPGGGELPILGPAPGSYIHETL